MMPDAVKRQRSHSTLHVLAELLILESNPYVFDRDS
jgi:hypothetical protein